MSHRRILATSHAILRCWETARRLGLFDEEEKFRTTIQNGDEEGEEAVFEYIIPVDKVPELSTDPVNLRLVTPATRRTDENGPLGDTAQRYVAGVQSLSEEVLYGVEDKLGYNAKEREEIWNKEVEEA